MCTIAGCRRYQRECGACDQNRCLSGASTKVHLGIRPDRRIAHLSKATDCCAAVFGPTYDGFGSQLDATARWREADARLRIRGFSTARIRNEPCRATFDTQLNDVQEAARAIGQQIHVLRANTEREIDAAFDTAKEVHASAMMVGPSTFFTVRRDQIVGLAARDALPTIYGQREFMAAGGLMSYGTSFTDAYRQAGVYSGKILGGARPAEMPMVQSVKFELLINLKVAKSLGLTFPPGLLAIAGEVIE